MSKSKSVESVDSVEIVDADVVVESVVTDEVVSEVVEVVPEIAAIEFPTAEVLAETPESGLGSAPAQSADVMESHFNVAPGTVITSRMESEYLTSIQHLPEVVAARDAAEYAWKLKTAGLA